MRTVFEMIHDLRYFTYTHLPEPLMDVSKRFHAVALWVVENLDEGPERSNALRKLLEAKDSAVRAKLSPGG